MLRFVPCCFDLSLVGSVLCVISPVDFSLAAPCARSNGRACLALSLPFLSLSFFLFGVPSFLFLMLCMGRGDVRGVWHGVGVGGGAACGRGVPGWLSDVWALCLLSTFLVPLLLLVGRSKVPLPHAMHGTWGCEGRLARGWRGGRGSVRAGCPVG